MADSKRASKNTASRKPANLIVRKRTSPDLDAAPKLDRAWFLKAQLVIPSKKPIAIRLDEDVIRWFKRQGPGYQTKINAVLKAYVDAHG